MRYPNARVELFDMVKETPKEKFDAALDVMGFHMLVTDSDRKRYLEHAYSCLSDHAPMLFFRESYSEEAEVSKVESFADFQPSIGIHHGETFVDANVSRYLQHNTRHQNIQELFSIRHILHIGLPIHDGRLYNFRSIYSLK